MKKIILFIGCVFLLACSNNDELNPDYSDNKGANDSRYNVDGNLVLKKQFSMALAKALAESLEVRNLIKTEALKKINYDYDVLYQLIKDEKMNDGKSLEDHLLNYISKDVLNEVSSQIPTLTIFVPSLGDEYFSAENWDIEKDIPVVAIRTTETNDVPIIEASGEEWLLEAQYTPISPIVVVKENERITANPNTNLRTIQNCLRSLSSNESTSLYFIDEAFNNTIDETEGISTRSRTSGSSRPPVSSPELNNEVAKVLKSHDVFNNTSDWQRDYIYYDLTPSESRGKINKNVLEYVVAFELVNPDGSRDATAVINKICDQTGDPTPNGNIRFMANCWTDGEFEFLIKCYVASTTGIGSEIKKFMRFSANDLFSPVINHGVPGRRGGVSYYSKKFRLNSQVRVNLPLFEWNLEVISPSIKLSIEEVDSQETIRQSSSTTTEFATNFEYNMSTGETTKVGLKFGASQKKSMTVLYEMSTTKGNDDLGDVVINFGDDVIKSKTYYTYQGRNIISGFNDYWLDFNDKYNSGWYRIYISPKVK